ncbi:MAG: hypothetical protein ABSA33_05415 [Candidatus Micrarchaeaceae archaeon]|jgi:hypothetical protein
MDTSNEDGPLEQSLITTLVAYANQFEFAVADGHDIVAAAVAQAMVQSLARFSSRTFSRVCSVQVGTGTRPDFLSSPSRHTSVPDAAYLEVVRIAVTKFKERLATGNVAGAIEALTPTGILAEKVGPLSELRDLEMKLSRVGGARRLEFLPQVAKLAFWAGDINKAEEYAAEAVRLEPPGDPFSDGEATHDGNMVLGLVALQRGDIERAKVHLLESARANVTGAMRMTGPNLSLASELLQRNERDVVIRYLQECSRFWVVGRKALDAWIVKIRNGESIVFDPLHLSL